MFYLLKLYLFLFLIFLQQCSANVIECEGFVKSAVQINLSDIKVKLFTSQGNLKYEAECNPQNGYFLRVQPFLIPIYNKGKYLVEIDAADGYVFEPELYEIEIGNNGGCSEELNFNLAGLKISGKILDGEDSSLVLGLFKQEDGELVEKTIIDKKGKYNFVAWPGKYVISPFSGSTKCLNQDKMEIEVGTTPLTIKPDLQIEGYSLEVNVVDEKGDPFLSTNVVLQSDKQIKFENLPLSAEQPITFNEGQNWFYKFNTNSSGSTLINCLPPGKYVVNAEQKVLNYVEAVFDRKSIVMKSTTANKVTISVKTFNIDGIVLTSQQIPFKHVAIYLNGKFKTMSGRDGKFMVTNVSPGRHLFEAEKEHFEFNILYNIDISSKTKEGITFFPTRVSVCGQLFLCDNVQTIEFTTPDEYYIRFSIFDGTFCKMLSPEKYTVKLISANILPNQIEIDLKRGPIFNLLFVNQTKFLTTDEKGLLTENMKDALTVVSSWTSLLSIMLNLSALYLVIAGLFIANLYYLWNRR